MTGRHVDDAGRYELTERIATGGMGEVWKATDQRLGRTVAVKLLKEEYADDATFRRRFDSEARHAGALHHPGIAAVFDYGETSSGDGSRPWLVMEYVDGQPLSALLRPGSPMDEEIARDLMAQAADALAVAHERGIVHRDVKPANLLVTPDRRVKVTDFGIARAAEGMALTQTGQVMGTPQYFSPEQARGERASAASDVYALGVVAYECLTGHRPFTGDSPITTALAHLRDPVPDLPEHVSPDLAAVVRHCLAKDPAQRFGSAADLASALRDPASGAAAAGAAATVLMDTDRSGEPDAEDEAAGRTAVLPAGAAASPGSTRSGPAATGTTRRPPGRDRGLPPWLLVLLALLILGLILWAIVGSDADTGAEPSQPETSSSAPAPQQTEEPAPAPSSAEPTPDTFDLDLGRYLGRDVKDVTSDLEDLGLSVSPQEVANDGSAEEDAVTAVSPSTGLAEGDSVTVSYAGAPPEEPDQGTPGNEGNGNEGNGQDKNKDKKDDKGGDG